VKGDLPVIGAPAANDPPAADASLEKEMFEARAAMARAMTAGLNMDPTPAGAPNLLFFLQHDGAVLDAVVGLLMQKGLLTDEEIKRAIVKELRTKTAQFETNNERLRHQVVVASMHPPGRG
jgi:hypothetical protein